MLLSDIKNYIKSEQSVSITDLTMFFNMDREELETPLEILCSRGHITADLPFADTGQPSKCSGCPMGCKPKEQESCSPTASFIIYNWVNREN